MVTGVCVAEEKTNWREAIRTIVKLRTQKRKLSKLTMHTNIETEKRNKKVFLALSNLWGKEQGVERAFPVCAFTKRPSRRQPGGACRGSGSIAGQSWRLQHGAQPPSQVRYCSSCG